MIVCSCNALSDKDVDAAIQNGVCRTAEVYAAKKCRVQCGQCVPGIVCRLKAALQARYVPENSPSPALPPQQGGPSLEMELRGLERETAAEARVSRPSAQP